MITPKPDDQGRQVAYWNGFDRLEWGVINGWNDAWVHVRFGSDRHGKPCLRETLFWPHDPRLPIEAGAIPLPCPIRQVGPAGRRAAHAGGTG